MTETRNTFNSWHKRSQYVYIDDDRIDNVNYSHSFSLFCDKIPPKTKTNANMR